MAKLDPWDRFERGHALSTPECAELMRRVQHKLTDGLTQARGGPLQLDLEAALGAMQWIPVEETIHYWSNLESPAFAVQALAESWRYSLNHTYTKGGECRFLTRLDTPRHERFQSSLAHLDHWPAARKLLAGLKSEVYQQTRESLEGLFANAPHTLQTALAFLFPDHAPWAEHCLQAALAGGWGGQSWVLLSCQIPLEGAQTVLARSQPRSSFSKGYLSAYDFAVSALDMQGEAILPALTSLYESELTDDRRTAVLAVSQIASPEAANWLASKLEDAKVRPQLVDYFKANPEVGRPVLSELSAGKSKLAQEAAAVAELVY